MTILVIWIIWSILHLTVIGDDGIDTRISIRLLLFPMFVFTIIFSYFNMKKTIEVMENKR